MDNYKKIMLFFSLVILGLVGMPSESFAQKGEMTKEQKEALKNTQKLQKAKIDLGKSLEKLLKEQAKLEKMKIKFERDNNAGRLSPNDIDKINKKIDDKERSILKLEDTIEELEDFIRENEDGI